MGAALVGRAGVLPQLAHQAGHDFVQELSDSNVRLVGKVPRENPELLANKLCRNKVSQIGSGPPFLAIFQELLGDPQR